MLSSIPSSARSSYVAIPLCFNGLGQGKIYRKPRFDHANIGVPFWFPVYKCSLEYLESNHIKSQRFLGWNMKLWLTCFNHRNGTCLITIFKARCSSFRCEASPGTSSFRCSIAPWTSPGIVGGHPNGFNQKWINMIESNMRKWKHGKTPSTLRASPCHLPNVYLCYINSTIDTHRKEQFWRLTGGSELVV